MFFLPFEFIPLSISLKKEKITKIPKFDDLKFFLWHSLFCISFCITMDIDTFSRSSQQFILVADDYILSSKFNSVHNFLKYQHILSSTTSIFSTFPHYFHYGRYLTSSTIIFPHTIKFLGTKIISFPKTARKEEEKKRKKQRKIAIRHYRSRGFTFKSHSGMAFPVTLFIPLLPTS